MEEVDPQIDEGTDTLVGVERIQFADQTVVLAQSGNYEPTGRLIISGLPAREDQPLTVSGANIYDANNPGSGPGNVSNITYRWQIERNDGTGDYINIPGSFGQSFTPGDEHTGLRIRVVGTYVDAGGVTETVTSASTDIVIGVNDEPVGPLLISDMSPTEGQAMTATVAFTDPDGITDAFEEGLLTYQWQYAGDPGGPWTNVAAEAGGNNRTFTPGVAHVEQYLRVQVTYTDDLAVEKTVTSQVTGLVGNHIVSNAATINAAVGDAQGGTTDGDDMVVGGNAANNISGGAGNDVISGGSGSDTLAGNEGNDTLTGGEFSDTVEGGAGDDIIIYGSGDDTDFVKDGGDGTDTLRIVGSAADGADFVSVQVVGGAIAQVGGSVQNVEIAQADLGSGVDTLSFNNSTEGVTVDLLTGAATGFAYIRNVENIIGSTGDDTLLGNGLDNVLDGGNGVDTMRAGFGNDTLRGGVGADILYGDQGDDTLVGGDGADRLDGGAGSDTASYAGGPVVTVSLATNEAQAGAGGDTLVGIENLVGSSNADTLTGNAAANLIDGGAGGDTMAGADGDDTYIVDNAGDSVDEADAPGSGNDTVRTNLAAYVLAANVENLVLTGSAISGTGNAGDNELTGNAGNNLLDGAGGTDTVVLDGHITDYEFALNGSNIEVTSSAGGTDTLTSIERVKVSGQVYDLVPGTNGANNPLNGSAANELVLGFNGVDLLVADGGNDILIGGAANDTMRGGTGSDTYVVNNGGDLVDETGGDGIDMVYSSVTRNLDNGAHALGEIENVTLTGNGNINALGNELDNALTGNAGDNTLTGRGGADTLAGGGGDDILNGGGANDILAGGAGNDTLNGGGGLEDVAVFSGAAWEYTFASSGAALASVVHSGTDGTDTLSGIERLQFGDGESLTIQIGTDGDDDLTADDDAVIFALAGDDTVTGGAGNDIIIGGAGDDTLFGSDVGTAGDNATTGATDDDTFIWNVGDGVDAINGGFEGAGGDTLVVNGNGDDEVFGIYTYDEAVARLGYAGDDEVEIIVTRHTGADAPVIIAELTDIEEVLVNAGGGSNQTQMFGDFSLTSLRPNTITVIGSAGNDTVNLSTLLSAHRIVFKTGGGNDTIIGALRPQDVIELPPGMSIADFEVTIEEDGRTTLVGDGHSISFVAPDGMPQFNGVEDDDDDEVGADDDDDNDNDADTDDDDDSAGNDTDDDDTATPAPAGSVKTGTGNTDVLTGTAGDDNIVGLGGDDVAIGDAGADVISAGEGADLIRGGEGRDMIFSGGGDDQAFGGEQADVIYGDAGADRLFGEGGNDLITAGAGDDTVFGGAGDDLIVAEIGDGNDTYFGDNSDGGTGRDTLDLSAATAAVSVNLGTGALDKGNASSSQTGNDTIWSIENVNTGSGNDTIVASKSANIMNGGAGNDTFRFLSTAAADGDTVQQFEPGDRIDFSAIDANLGTTGDQTFTIVSGASLTAAGQLAVSFESRADGDFTVVQGNVDGEAGADFRIEIEGHHNLNNSNVIV
jgi:Ca2+-binding RTX toxin-like protein